MVDQRKFERKTFDEAISYVVPVLDLREIKLLNLAARAFDISDDGIGITTDYSLEAGHVLRFTDGGSLNRDMGIVRWSRECGNKHSSRAGVKFV